MGDRCKRRNIYHINLLHKWYRYEREADETVGFAEEDGKLEDEYRMGDGASGRGQTQGRRTV